MMNFIKPEYLVSLYLILNKQDIVTLKDLGDYAGKLNKELKENNIEAMFLYSDNYIEEMLQQYSDYFLKGTYTIYYAIKRKVSKDVLSEQFIAYLSNDVLKVVSDLKLKEKKMTTEEKVKVMTAYTEGKQIQIYNFSNKTWEDINHEPVWDWDNCLYRVKPESKYRPYKDVTEMLDDINERRVAIQHPVFPGIWLKHEDYEVEEMIAGVDSRESEILLGKNWTKLSIVFNHFTYLDGKPFGIKE